MSAGWRDVLDGGVRAAVVEGDALEVLRAMPDCSVDAICTDPPAGIDFMGLDFDSDRGGRAAWIAWLAAIMRECLRVAKPGAHALVWALPRTSHWTATAVEDAGWEVRDVIVHLQSQGFPKSLDVSKAIDKALGAEREVVGSKGLHDFTGTMAGRRVAFGDDARTFAKVDELTAPATDAARRWDGWGTALAPKSEHWILARKPLSERNVAANVLRWGVGAINVDGCRVSWATNAERGEVNGRASPNSRWVGECSGGATGWSEGKVRAVADITHSAGRWPPNLLLSHVSPDPETGAGGCERVGTRRITGNVCFGTAKRETAGYRGGFGDRSLNAAHYADADGMEEVEAWRCAEGCPVAVLDAQAGERPSPHYARGEASIGGAFNSGIKPAGQEVGYDDADDACVSRFFPCFYTPKAAGDAERWFYCRACKLAGPKSLAPRHAAHRADVVQHPTVKPVDLMRWLVRLITPPDGVVLDPFAGTGSTGVACRAEGFRFIGIEREPDYCALARARLDLGGAVDGQQSFTGRRSQ